MSLGVLYGFCLASLAERRRWQRVNRAAYTQAPAVRNVGVDHGRLDVLVPEELLHGADVVPGLEEVRGEGVAEAVTGSPAWLAPTAAPRGVPPFG